MWTQTHVKDESKTSTSNSPLKVTISAKAQQNSNLKFAISSYFEANGFENSVNLEGLSQITFTFDPPTVRKSKAEPEIKSTKIFEPNSATPVKLVCLVIDSKDQLSDSEISELELWKTPLSATPEHQSSTI